MRALLEQVMGLRLSFEEPTTVEFTTTEGDKVQVELDENGIAIVGDLGRDAAGSGSTFARRRQSERARQQARERLGAPAASDFFEAPAEALVVLGEVVEARELGEPC